MTDESNRLLQLIETMIHETKGWLPERTTPGAFHSSNANLTPGTRARLAFLEDSLRKARAVTGRVTASADRHNPNCDGSHCSDPHGQVRLLPLGKIPDHGNMILCHSCYEHEIAWRTGRNRELGRDAQFSLTPWEDLKVYE